MIETHISMVFLAGDRAYKLKRAVKFPYLDFSTPAQRQRACDAELDIEPPDCARFVPGGAGGIARHADGTLGWAGERRAGCEWVVVMRGSIRNSRSTPGSEGRLGTTLIFELISHIVAFHARAEPRPDAGGATAMAAIEPKTISVYSVSGRASLHPSTSPSCTVLAR